MRFLAGVFVGGSASTVVMLYLMSAFGIPRGISK